METTRLSAVVVAIEDGVVHVLFDRPEARNAINEPLLRGLEAAIELAERRQARVLTLRGAGGVFCAGADLAELQAMQNDRQRLEVFMSRLSGALDRLEAAPFVSVAIVEGYAVAGGCEIMLACDVVLAASDALIGDRHLEYGLAPAAAGSVRLVRNLPKARSSYLLLSGELLSGDEAAAWGMATFSIPLSRIDATAEAIVRRLSSRSRDAITTVKSMIVTVREGSQDAAVRSERKQFLLHAMTSADFSEGLKAFNEHRKPVFPSNQEP